MQPGLIQNTGPDPNKVQSFGYDPNLRTVAPNETVSEQLDKILSPGSSYLSTETNERAKSQVSEDMAGRGLLHSSINLGARRGAEIDRALPIAAADANTYSTAARDNQGASNVASQFNAGEMNQTEKIAQQGQIQSGLIADQGAQTRANAAVTGTEQRATQAQGAGFDTAMQTLRGEQAQELQTLTSNFQQLMQTSQSATSYYTNASNQVAAIMSNPDTTPAQKDAAMAKVTQQLRNYLTLAGGVANVDLTRLLDFTTTGPTAGTTGTAPTAGTAPATQGTAPVDAGLAEARQIASRTGQIPPGFRLFGPEGSQQVVRA